jgi:pSer/pThr/pTyr-binding forkhead associated (FHA) protein
MQLSLIVLTPGKMNGKSIPVSRSPFLIGRDSHCHLRAASLAISNRHCAVTMRGSRVFVRDFNSTNGTRVNDELLVGETELKNRDRLAVGPLQFGVRIEHGVGVSQATPLPANHRSGGALNEDEMGHLVLSAPEDSKPESVPVDRDGVPTGDTREEFILPPVPTQQPVAKTEPENPSPAG